MFKDFATRGKYGTFPTTLGDEEYCDNWIGRNAIELLDRAPEGKPWFMQINFTDPHDPFDLREVMSRSQQRNSFSQAVR